MKVFSINIPPSIAVRDRYSSERVKHETDLHVVAPNWEAAVKLITTCYATHIDEAAIELFKPQEGMPYGMVWLEGLGRVSDLSGSINIQGGVFIETEVSTTSFVYANEGPKFRWVQFVTEPSTLAPIEILKELHKVF
ncbi:hypothetical protein HJB53_29910 [Rhizobium lentis]|uniref:hypothetical protein n=1 Tax=Rhizobium lentis TaxID=1138194 RepID=UPI001C83A47C|nr:hypothetical protein [Rhizobium lentis]MBX5130706.1 hypothetical protein [Rhizobium lentis]